MTLYTLLLLAAALAPASPPRVHVVPATAEKDVKCLTLALIGMGHLTDPDKLKSGIAESWFYVGRLDAGEPGVDLKQATARGFEALKHDPDLKALGASCDAQFTARAADLVRMGQDSQPTKP